MTTHNPQNTLDFLDTHRSRFLDELAELIRIPSISTMPEHRAAIDDAARWLATHIRQIGLSAEILETDGHPVVLGEWRGAKDAPTVLIYGHYDVQPVDPRADWTSPPFEATVRDGRLYARGATDDKGQLFMHLKAIEAWLETTGALPVNVILLLEGEEETGSEALMPFVHQYAERLAADVVVISDSPCLEPGIPTIYTSLRGMVGLDIRVDGPSQDLHSGIYGGAVINPATALAKMLATLHDEHWKVTAQGFYDRVDAATELRSYAAKAPFDPEDFLAQTGAPGLGGEAGFSPLEQTWIRPTLEIHGLSSGYTGEGVKTIVPSTARAKLTCRLVSHQDPNSISQSIEHHLRSVAPPQVRVHIDHYGASPPWTVDPTGPVFEAARRVCEQAFDRPAVLAGGGGGIGIVPELTAVLGAPILLMGFGSPGENAHAPNEWLSLEHFDKGMKACVLLLDELRCRLKDAG